MADRSSKRWRDGAVRTTLRFARSSDRLWIPGAFHGPTRPWADGRMVGALVRCR